MSIVKFFAISDLVKRLDKIASDNRYDLVSRTMHEIFEKRASNNPNEIVSSADIKKIWSNVYNLNPNSTFADRLDDVFESKEGEVFTEGSPFRVAGFNEDFRPTPVEVVKSEDEIIKDASFEYIKKIVANNVVYPQYHYNNFISVASAGENSGIALWTVSFNTKCGEAKINIPVTILKGSVLEPKVFYASGLSKASSLDAKTLQTYSTSYNPPDRNPLTELSGFDQIGTSTLLTDNQDIKEGEGLTEDNSISVSYSIPVDESLTANVSEAEESIRKAIEQARDYVEKRIKKTNEGARDMNINLQINYSGGLGMDGEEIIPEKDKPVEGIFAFNATESTKKGLKTITVPVMITSNKCIANAFYSDSGAIELSPENVREYFNSQNNEPEVDSFSNAFLAYLKTDATYSELLKGIKETTENNDFKTAASYLQIISERFGENAFKTASQQYIDFVKEASDKRTEESSMSYLTSAPITFME